MPMPNNTFEDYKIAVKNKYEEEKNGKNFIYLSSPTRAKLRNLCWEIFEKENAHQDDLTVFNTFLGLPFDLTTKNKFRDEINRFRPIETFFKGETDPSSSNVDAVNLGAILLDFHPRPFSKFRIYDLGGGSNEEYNPIDSELDIIEEVNEEFISEKENAVPVVVRKPITLVINFKKKFFETLLKKSKRTIAIVALIFCLIFAVVYLAFFKKECMQWSEDHYDLVDCSLKTEEPELYNNIEPLDKRVVNLKKIKVCDTTTFFNKNDEAVIWYAKTEKKGIDFFNTHGRHPENNKPLRPVTHYIFRKYVTKF